LDNPKMSYQKFCYWTGLAGLREVRNALEEKGLQLTDETHLPCRVLRESMNIAFVSPSAWNGFCKRRTSWFRKSEMSDKFLIVSKSPMDLRDLDHLIMITDSNFRPDRFPSSEEISQLIQSWEYQKRKPSEWEKTDPLEKDFYKRWFERQQRKEPFDFDQIVLGHGANHANFIDPQFFENVNGEKAPYSISDSLHVCSSCLEFFNILGNQWRVKYVVPCIGAVQFARLPMGKYFEVKIVKAANSGGSVPAY
jgi:hypothetical protein